MKPLLPFFVLMFSVGFCGIASAGPPKALDKPPATASATDLTGSVVGAKGEPLMGATVYIYTAAPRVGSSAFCPSCYPDCGKRQTTDARGAFRVKALSPALIFRVLVVRDGYDPLFVPNVDPKRGAIRVALKPQKKAGDPTRLISGRVLDDLGQPIVGAVVEPIGLKTPTGGSFGDIPGMEPLAITNEKGGFRLHSPKPDAIVFVKVAARGFAPTLIDDLRTGDSSRAIGLARGATVNGVLRDAAGKPITNATIQIVHTDRSAQAFLGWFEIGTDKDGKFSLPNLPARKEFWVLARMDGLAGKGVATTRTRILTSEDGTASATLPLVASPAVMVTGRVVLSDGRPIPPGTRLMLGRCETWDVLQYPLAKDGKFSFANAPNDDLTLYAYVPGYAITPDAPKYHAEWGYYLNPSPALTRNVTITLTPEKPQSTNSGN